MQLFAMATTYQIQRAEFLFGAADAATIRKQSLPEIAVAGRSNVGKSTFLNRLMGRKTARVSATPGRTRQLNFFEVEGFARVGESEERSPFAVTLVDMPGFGYAKLSKEEREGIARMAIGYVRERRQLGVLLLLTDVRREPQEDELALQQVCAESGCHCVVVVTKLDKLKRAEQRRALQSIASAYHLEPADLLCAGEGISVQPIWERILGML
jgi:GTP-binding protein